jgi:outer membrane receptor protein involved in Fe transport
MRHRILGASASAIAVALAGGAHAQTAAAEPAAVDEVVVTGSRIVRDGYEAPTPTTVATTAELAITAPANISEGLNKLPIFQGSGGLGGTGGRGVGQGSQIGAGTFLDLRNFGSERTLILLDGRRVAPTTFDGRVDVNSLPQALVQRVDVVTGGASAVYGSDAVTGVVNYVLDHNFTGLKGVVQGGQSSRNDAENFRTNLAFGTPVFDRGHLLLSAEYSNSVGLKAKEDRDWAADFPLLTGSGTAANPRHVIYNARQSTSAFGGLIVGGPLDGMMFNPDGSLQRFDTGLPSGSNGLTIGGDGTYHQNVTMVASLRTAQAFGRFEYEFSDNVTGFAQVGFSEGRSRYTQATANRSASSTSRIQIFSGNPYLRPEVQQILTDTNTPSFILSAYALDYGRPRFDVLTNSLATTVGLEGKFGGYNWEVFYSHSDGRTRMVQHNNSNNRNFYAAVDAVRAPDGQIVCRVALTNPGLFPGCVPINPMGRGNQTPEAIAFTTNTTQWQVVNTMDDFGANIAGDLFSLPAGPVSFALGGEYRRNVLEQTSSADPNEKVDFTGLRGGFSANTLNYVGRLVAPAYGSNSVWEVNGEVLVPLLKDVAFARNLDLSAAVRYTEYSDSGPATTWKVGLDWRPTEDLRFRIVRSRDIRAPTLYDLYAGAQISNVGFTDELTNQSLTTQSVERGNPDLVPEVANSLVAGVVYSPSFLPSLRLSLDYYDITIDNAIGSVSTAVANRECIRAGGASPFCSTIVRPFPVTNTSPENFPTLLLPQNLNIASTYTHGVDFEASYNVDLASLTSEALGGNLALRMLVSYQPVLKERSYEGARVLDQAGVAHLPEVRINWRASYLNGPFAAHWQTRWNNGGAWDADPTLVYTDSDFGNYAISDLTLSYAVDFWGLTFNNFVTVENLFDREPDIFPGTCCVGHTTPVVSGHDIIGRRYTVGTRFSRSF